MSITSISITFADSNVTFSGTQIKECSIVEEINPASVEAPANTLRVSIYSTDADFSITYPSGFYANLKEKEPLEVNGVIDGTPLYLGRFYLQKWTSASEHEATFEAIDETGILNDVPLAKDIVLAQDILDGSLFIGDVIEAALEKIIATTDFEIDLDLYSVPAYGWIKSKQSYRDILCQLALAGGAYVTCSRSSKITFRMLEIPGISNDIEYTQIDERDASITWTGDWLDNTDAAYYESTWKAMSTSGTYPNTYFTFEFDGVGFTVGYALLGYPDTPGRFYVEIDGEDWIAVNVPAGDGLDFLEWESDILTDSHHSIKVIGFLFGGEPFGSSVIHFDYIKLWSAVAPSYATDYILTGADKGLESPVEQRNLVTGVEVTAHNYIWDGEINIKIYEGELDAGTYFLEFDEPHAAYELTNATEVSHGIDWIKISVADLLTVTITGRKYVDSQTIYGIYNMDLDDNDRKNIIKITDVPFIHPLNAETIARNIYNYYQQRYVQKTRLIAHPIAPGDSALIDTQAQQKIAGILEKMTTDLGRGFVANVEIIGVLTPCENEILTENLTVLTGETQTYYCGLDLDIYTADLQGTAILEVK